jgi:superfamily II DNA or RNA helicase
VIQLRKYQVDVIEDFYECLEKHREAVGKERTVVVALPTGAGKTVTAGKLISDTVSRGEKALFLVSFKTLLFQSVESFSELSGLEVGIIASGVKNPKPEALVQVASIDTIVNRPKPEGVTLVIVDEAHTAGFAASQRWIFDTNAHGDWLHWDKKAWVVGLTATPKRTKKSEYLGQVYSHLVAGPTPIELMAVGEETEYREGLCPAIYKGLLPGAQPDLSSVKTRMGDYAPTELDRVVNTPEVTDTILDAWEKLALPDGDLSKGKLTLFFGTSLKHAEAVANAFNERFRERAIAAGFEDGQIFKFLEGDDSSAERKFWFEKLSTRQILGLSSVDILSVGFDVKEIEVVIPRPTKSEVIQEQQEGRGARVAPHIGQQQFIIFDIGLNSLKLGRIDDPKVYDTGPKATSKGGQVPQKQCPECGEIVPALLMECPSCHYEFPKKEKEAASGNLVTLESKEDMKGRKIYQRAASYGRRKGYLPGYATMRFVEETKTWKELPEIVVGDLLLVEKDRFVKFVGYASAGRVVQTRVKHVAEEDGLISLLTGNGRIRCSPEEAIAVGKVPKKEWKALAIYGEDTMFNRRDYLDFLKAKAKEKSVKNPESWIKNHFITEFTTWQAEPLEA